MEKERYLVFDNEKGVLVPLAKEDRAMSAGEREEKAERIQLLLKGLIRQTVRDTVKECNMLLTEEWKEHEKRQETRWQEMDEHFRLLDEQIREKQNRGKRKKKDPSYGQVP